MVIELTTLRQVQYHLQMGECVYFHLEDGFGFFKKVEPTDMLKVEDLDILGEEGILGVIQPDKGSPIVLISEDKNTYIDKIKDILDTGHCLYVEKGLNFQLTGK